MDRKTKRRATGSGAVMLAGAGVLVWFVGSRRRSGGRGRTPTSAPPVGPTADVELGEAPFPPPKQSTQWDRLRSLARTAEDVSKIKGLYSYLLATAKAESAAVPSAMNTETDGAPALRLFCRDWNFQEQFANNPWRPSVCDASDPLADRWAYSGGWFQMMPVVALDTGDGRGHRHDPARVFDPPFAVAYATDLVRRLKKGYGAKTWGDIRAGWALPRWAKPSSTAEGKAVVIEKFIKRLGQVASMGADANLATKTVSTKSYPGFTTVLHALLAAEGRTQAGAA